MVSAFPFKSFNWQTITQRGDIIFAMGLVMVLVLLIIPVPHMLLDMALAISIAFSILILMTALFIGKPLEFSTFPTVLLVSTLIRLALDVASTRLILSHGHEGTQAAGKVIQAFGHFVMGGNFIIGIIVFAILIIVNFVVITKGSGRIAEVAARFSLDAMPGKQMAIDADLNAGLITEDVAKLRRKELEGESSFYGSMDGAAKFVRGDAIACLLITFINIIGGIVIGTFQMGMDFSSAIRGYTILTVGEGLVSQIPSLIVSMASGMLVSKAGVDGSADKAFFKQLGAYPTALGLSSFLMGAFAILPGMPFFPFLFLCIGAGVSSWKISQSQDKDKETQASQQAQESQDDALKAAQVETDNLLRPGQIDHLKIELGYSLLSLLNLEEGKKLPDLIKNLRTQLIHEMGVVLPSVRIMDNVHLPAETYVVRIKELESGRGSLKPAMLMVMDGQGEDITIEGEDTLEPTFGLPARWIRASDGALAEKQGLTVVDASTVLMTHLTEIIKDNLSELLTFVDTQKMLDDLGDSYKKLLNDMIPAQITVGGIQRVLQNLVSERVSIRDLPTILEAISEACTHSRHVGMITEHVRLRLSRQITFGFADEEGVLSMVSISPQWEQTLIGALVGEGESKNLALAPSIMQQFIEQVTTLYNQLMHMGDNAVLVTNGALRPYVHSVLQRIRPSTIVLSQNEIHSKIKLKNLGQI